MRKKLITTFVFLLTFSLAAVTLMTMSGCGDNGEEPCVTPTGGFLYDFSESEIKRDVVRLWIDNEDYAEALKTAFEAQYPNIILEYEEIGHVDSRARLELLGADGADVIVFPHDHVSLALRSNIVARVPSEIEDNLRARMLDTTLGTVESCWDDLNNRPITCDAESTAYLFGAPLAAETMAVFYNKAMVADIFPELTDFENEITMDMIIEKSYEYNQLGADRQVLFAVDAGNAYDMHPFFTSFGYEIFGPNHNDKTMLNVTSQEMIDALTFIQNEFAYNPATSNRIMPETSVLTGEFIRNSFYSGDIPIITSGPWGIPDSIAALGDNLGVIPFPTLKGNQPITYSGVQVVAVSSYSRVPASAWTLLEFMTSDEGLNILYSDKGQMPALIDLSVIEGIEADPYIQSISAQLAFSHPMPTIPEMGYVWGTIGTMLADTWNGTLTPQQAADKAKTGYDGLAGLTG